MFVPMEHETCKLIQPNQCANSKCYVCLYQCRQNDCEQLRSSWLQDVSATLAFIIYIKKTFLNAANEVLHDNFCTQLTTAYMAKVSCSQLLIDTDTCVTAQNQSAHIEEHNNEPLRHYVHDKLVQPFGFMQGMAANGNFNAHTFYLQSMWSALYSHIDEYRILPSRVKIRWKDHSTIQVWAT